MSKFIVVASKNPVKVQAALSGFQRMFPEEHFITQTVSVPSLVADQPLSDQETLQGALNRARLAQQQTPSADYWVGIEGGIGNLGEEMTAFAWIVVLDKNQCGKSRTGTFFLPPEVTRLVQAGKELGEADDIIFQRANSKQENGAVGLLTGNVVERAGLYEQAVVLALIPFRNPTLYPTQDCEAGWQKTSKNLAS
jgi:inosine/xanthosine triphosphatase